MTPGPETRSAAVPAGPANRSLAACLGVVLGGAGVTLWLLRSAADRAAHLYPEGLPANPYFVPEHFVLLYMKVPAVVVALIVMLILPGACLALAARPQMGFSETLVKGFGVSTIAHVAGAAALKWTLGPMAPDVFIGWIYGFAIVSWAILFQVVPTAAQRAPWSRTQVTIAVCLCYVATVAFLPMILWQDLTADGAEILFAAQSLDEFMLPRWPKEIDVANLGQGLLFQPVVASWFLFVFGPLEVSLRLPLVLFLPVLFAATMLAIEHASPRRLTSSESWCVAASLFVFTTVLVFNATYSQYTTDPTSPAAGEYATVLGLLCTIYFLWTREWVWFAAYVTMGHLSRPTEFLFLGTLGVAAGLLHRPRSRYLLPIGLGVGLAFAITALLSIAYLADDVAAGGGGTGLLSRYAFLQLWDPQKIGMVAVGGGLLPIFGIAAFKQQDIDTRVLSVAWALLFVAFYVPATYAVHHLAPIMVLPIVIFWRTATRTNIRALVPTSTVAALAAIVFSVPTQQHLHRYQSLAAQSIRYEIGDVFGTYEERRKAALAANEAMSFLLPARLVDAATDLVPETLALAYYAQKKRNSAEIYAIVRPLDQPLPASVPEARGRRSLVYVTNPEAWQQVRFGTFAISPAAALYALEPETLFRSATANARNYMFAPSHLPLLGRLF